MATTGPALHGLSRDVTLAVLPRLYFEELVTELTRRNISFGGYSIQQGFLVGVLKDAMIQEYHNLEDTKFPSDDVANDRNFQLTPYTELAEREQFQFKAQQEYSQTLSGICPTPNIGNRLATETTTQCHSEIDTSTSRESSSNDDGKCADAYPDVTASLSSNMTSAGPIADVNCTTTESGSNGTATGTSAISRPLLQLDNCSLKTEIEQEKSHSDAIQPNNTGFQSRNSMSNSMKHSTFSKSSSNTCYSCKDCTFRTEQKRDFMRHTRIHTGEKPFKCSSCDYRATRREHLTLHMLRHSGKKPYKCSDCDFRAAQKCRLSQHMRKHTGEKPYLCDECGYRTAHKTDIRRHKATHTGDKPYVCDVCGYRTTRNAYLVAHQRKHTGEKPYVCGDCDYRSVEKGKLSRHMKRHTDRIPLCCDQCGFMTTLSATLITHKTGHSGARPCDNANNIQAKVLSSLKSPQHMPSDAKTQEYHKLESDKSNNIADGTTRVTDAEIAELEPFQCQMPETSSNKRLRIFPTPDEQNNFSLEALHQHQDNEGNTANNRSHTYTTNVYNIYNSDICSDIKDLRDDETMAIPASANLEVERSGTTYATEGMATPTTVIGQSPAEIDDISFVMGIKQEEEESSSQPYLTETFQGTERAERAAMTALSSTVTTGELMLADHATTAPVLQYNEHADAEYKDEKITLGKAVNKEGDSRETELDKPHNDGELDSQAFYTERNNSRGHNTGASLEPHDIMLYACKECDFRTKYKSELLMHTRIHTGEKPFMCTLCDYRAARRANLKRHLLRHSGEKRYTCDECGFKTTHKSLLIQHMRKHTGEKPYMCDECGFRTAHRTEISRHMDRHLGNKPHACDVCGYRALKKADLEAHKRRRHSGKKPYVCEDCGFKTAHQASLARHMKRHTDGNPL